MNIILLKDLITGASIGLSPAVAWLTFVSTWREKRRAQLDALRRRLLELQAEVEYIGNWAQTEYDDTSDNNRDWNNPFWHVLDFPSAHIVLFNRESDPSEIGHSLSDAMVQLEASISRFKNLLHQHRQFVENGIKTYSKPFGDDPPRLIFQPTLEWRQELYRLNKEIHVRGIGNSISREGLHSTCKKARTELNAALSNLRQRRYSKIVWVGHSLAIVLGIVGLFFLVVLLYEIGNNLAMALNRLIAACG